MEKSYITIPSLICASLLLPVNVVWASALTGQDYSNLGATRGVNIADYTMMDREGGWPPFLVTPPPLHTRMVDMSSKGFNMVRVPFYWEAYTKNPTEFLNEAVNIAATAEKYNLAVVFCMCQWHTGGQYTGPYGEGGGFPREATGPYATEEAFWRSYYSDAATVNGIDIWNAQAIMMKALIHKVDSYSSVIGYEPLNEPYIWHTWQYAKLGHLQTYIDSKLRAITSKQIWFDKVEPQGYVQGVSGYPTMPGVGYVDMRYDPLTAPAVSNTVFAPHFYDKTTAADINWLINGYQSLASGWHVPYVIGEWGITTQVGTIADVSVFKSNNVGWIRWSYDPFDQYALMDTNYKPTANMEYLLSAMG